MPRFAQTQRLSFAYLNDRVMALKVRCSMLLALGIVTNTIGCGGGALTHDQAKQAVAANALIRYADHMTVDGISQADGSAEAIVRATIDGVGVNLKLRRYDRVWKWEFVETKGGGWIPPEDGIASIRESRRLERVREWAKEHIRDYAATADLLHELASQLPRNPAVTLREGFVKGRELRRKIAAEHPDPEHRARYGKLLAESPVDAWGNIILVEFGFADRSAMFLSVGPDKLKATKDDISCVAKGVREWDDEYEKPLFNYVTAFTLPEGLEAAVEPYRVHRFAMGSAKNAQSVNYVRMFE